ncbi:MAG: bifunctional folylpolyglutamate synthase/dihydrofolate synthase, partial [Blastocatellia bacterium]
MNFAESLAYLYSLGSEAQAMQTLALKVELESTHALCAALGNPERQLRAVHIAGTNGKGSTSAMTEAIAMAAGLRVGLYTSPHLVEITERFRVNGTDISPDDFARLATVVRAAADGLVARGQLIAPPSYFEQVTAIGFLYFVEKKVDLAVLEVGLGGRLDATNVCHPLVCAITPVSRDHQQYLGHTLAAIAGEKAGIIKTSAPVVVAPQDPEAWPVIEARCAAFGAPLIDAASQLSRSEVEALPARSVAEAGLYHFRCRTHVREYDIRLNLRGRYQITNACTAILIVEQLQQAGMAIAARDIVNGLARVNWPGRLELLYPAPDAPPHLLDGAHNPAGAQVLREFLDEHCPHPLTMIFGVMSDKTLAEIADILFPAANTVIATQVNNPRAATPDQIVGLTQGRDWSVETAANAGQAL